MKIISRAIASVFLTLLFLGIAHATDLPCDPLELHPQSKITILFVNGIGNKERDACESAKFLKNALLTNGLTEVTQFNFDYFHNPQNWKTLGDVNELRVQAAFTDIALSYGPVSDDDYYKLLGALYDSNEHLRYATPLLSPDASEKVRIISTTYELYDYVKNATRDGYLLAIPHSQGNAYVEAVYAIMNFRGETEALKRFRSAGVAPVAARPPNGTYISLYQDQAVFQLQARLNTAFYSRYSPAKPNTLAKISEPCQTQGCTSVAELQIVTGDMLLHQFVGTYLNERILDGSIQFRQTVSMSIALMVNRELDVLKSQIKCGAITDPFIKSQQGPLLSVVSGQPTLFTTTPTPKVGYPFGGYQWKTSDPSSTVVTSVLPESPITFNTAGAGSLTVTPVLQDGTVCTGSAATSQVLVQAPSTQGLFVDNFDGPSLDVSKWSLEVLAAGFTPTASITNGSLVFGVQSYASTRNYSQKFSGDKIVVEAAFAKNNAGGISVRLVDTKGVGESDVMGFGDVNYQDTGLFFSGTGRYATATPKLGQPTKTLLQYRLTVSKDSYKIERGISLDSPTQVYSGKLPNSISGRSFFLMIGNESGTGAFDWIRAYTGSNEITLNAAQFSAGTNIALNDDTAFSCRHGLVYNAPPYTARPNAGEWVVVAPAAGSYSMAVSFAALDSRPVDILVNGSSALKGALSNTTGGWCASDAKSQTVGSVSLRAGTNIVRLERNGVFPHLQSFTFVPQ